MVSGGIMCIPNRFTAPRGILMACMLPQGVEMGGDVSPSQRNDTVDGASAGKLQVACKALSIGHSLKRVLYKMYKFSFMYIEDNVANTHNNDGVAWFH